MKTTTENYIVPSEQQPFMITLTEIVNNAVKNGYFDNLKVIQQGLYFPAKD